jgi:phospholipid N-methyltransferase
VQSETAEDVPVTTNAMALFARNFFKFPSMLGSIVPSSRFLVRDVMAQIDWQRASVVVEFGPGVGTITKELLTRMRQDAVLVVIEVNGDFVQYLRSTISDPRLRVIHGSAASARQILSKQGFSGADYIISSLPYSLLSEAVRKEIVAESRLALKPQGSLVVFQYSRLLLPYLRSSFSSVRLEFQLLNILPASIFHCTP